MTGDTTNEVTDIVYVTEASGQTVLAYEVNISGAFTSANSNTNCGATVEVDGVNRNGRIDIDYTGTDLMRVRDLGLMNSTFNLRGVHRLPLRRGRIPEAPWCWATSPLQQLHTGERTA